LPLLGHFSPGRGKPLPCGWNLSILPCIYRRVEPSFAASSILRGIPQSAGASIVLTLNHPSPKRSTRSGASLAHALFIPLRRRGPWIPRTNERCWPVPSSPPSGKTLLVDSAHGMTHRYALSLSVEVNLFPLGVGSLRFALALSYRRGKLSSR
jgi:hypothetical protein